MSQLGAKVLRWFAPPDRSMMMFAGIWRSWRGDYGSKKEPNVGEHLLFSFLTTEPNDVVRPVHAQAMPLILRDEDARTEWLTASADQVKAIQSRPLSNDALEIIGDDEAATYVGGYLK
jgi:putative SOS response-associated peptidase YedK